MLLLTADAVFINLVFVYDLKSAFFLRKFFLQSFYFTLHHKGAICSPFNGHYAIKVWSSFSR